jgi:hypothetical protein
MPAGFRQHVCGRDIDFALNVFVLISRGGNSIVHRTFELVLDRVVYLSRQYESREKGMEAFSCPD